MKKEFKIIAYKMPPQENWNSFRDPAQKNPDHINEECYKKVAECGFTHGMGLLEHGAEVAERALDTAERCGLKYYVRDAINWANILHPDYYWYNGENYRKYQRYSSFAGVYIYDEPNANKYGDLAKMVKGYYDFFKGVGEPLVNLLPTYANCVEQLGAESYEKYIDLYAEQVPTDYILFDFYPFRVKDRVEEYLHDEFLYNCAVVARACKKSGKGYRAFIQSSVMDRGKTDLLCSMLDFQIHTHLAHGAEGIVYYYYWGDEEGNGQNGLVDWHGNPTELYEGAKRINREIKSVAEKLLECKWQAVSYIKGERAHFNEIEFARQTEGEACDKFKAEYDLVVGEFDCCGKRAYYLVNYTNPRLGLENEVECLTNGDYDLFINGERKPLNGKTVKLSIGGGALLLPR